MAVDGGTVRPAAYNTTSRGSVHRIESSAAAQFFRMLEISFPEGRKWGVLGGSRVLAAPNRPRATWTAKRYRRSFRSSSLLQHRIHVTRPSRSCILKLRRSVFDAENVSQSQKRGVFGPFCPVPAAGRRDPKTHKNRCNDDSSEAATYNTERILLELSAGNFSTARDRFSLPKMFPKGQKGGFSRRNPVWTSFGPTLLDHHFSIGFDTTALSAEELVTTLQLTDLASPFPVFWPRSFGR